MPKKRDLNGESPEPMPRGGARDTHPHTPGETPVRKGQHPNSLANISAKTWRPGQSGNPGGRTRTFFEVTQVCRAMTPDAIRRLSEIIHNSKTSNRDKISAISIILDRGLGKVLSAAEHIKLGEGSEGGLPGGMTVLLLDASRRRDASYRLELEAELRRITIQEEQRRDARADAIAEARAAMLRGEEVSPMLKMLVETHDAES